MTKNDNNDNPLKDVKPDTPPTKEKFTNDNEKERETDDE